MAPSGNKRPAAPIHRMKTRAQTRREQGEPSTGASDNRQQQAQQANPNPSKKRPHDVDEDSDEESRGNRPGKRPKTDGRKLPGANDPGHNPDDTSSTGAQEQQENDAGEDEEVSTEALNPEDDHEQRSVETGEDDDVEEIVRSPPRIVEDEIYWPAIREAYVAASNGSNIEFRLPCIVCRGHTMVKYPGCPEYEYNSQTGHHGEHLVILPCGHTIGDACLFDWTMSENGSGRPLSCPTCRCKLQCRDCSAPFQPWVLNDENQGLTPPMTVPEGGELHMMCNFCYAEGQLFRRTATGEVRITARGVPDNHALRMMFGSAVSQRMREVRRGPMVSGGIRQDLTGIIVAAAFTDMHRQMDRLRREIHLNTRPEMERWEEEAQRSRLWNRPEVDTFPSTSRPRQDEIQDVIVVNTERFPHGIR